MNTRNLQSFSGAGIGLRAPHYREVLDILPPVPWFEVHSENFFGAGGAPLATLERVRNHYPISLHGVGLSLGSADKLDETHLDKLVALVTRIEPTAVSEHLCWGAFGGQYLNDLLPLPYTEEALDLMCERVSHMQERLKRRVLIENVSSYLQFAASTIPEWEFIAALSSRTGCGILLDVNNIHVNSMNHEFDARTYLNAIPAGTVEEIHLAGFTDTGECLIDTHSTPVCDAVWALYADAIRRFGAIPTLIEWDADIPQFSVLQAEAARADRILNAHKKAA